MNRPSCPFPVFRVLLVCTGNAYHSPFTEILTNRLLVTALGNRGAARFLVSSAGTTAVPGRRMNPLAWSGLACLGYGRAASLFRSRALDAHLVDTADVVLTAGRPQRAAVLRVAPHAAGKVLRLAEWNALGAGPHTAASTSDSPEEPPLHSLAREATGLARTLVPMASADPAMAR